MLNNLPRGQTIAIAVAATILVIFMIFLWDIIVSILMLILGGVTIAFLLSPLAKRFENFMPRSWAVLSSLLCLLFAIVGIIMLLLPIISKQLADIYIQIPQVINTIKHWGDNINAQLSEWGYVQDGINFGDSKWITDRIGQFIAGLLARASGFAVMITNLSLTMVLAFYFIKDREKMLMYLELLVPQKYRSQVICVGNELKRQLGAYVRGALTVSVFTGAITAIGLAFIGVKSYIVLGLVMAICDLIPYFGPLLGAIPILLLTMNQGFNSVIYALGVIFIAQQLEGLLITPRVMSSAAGLHPAVVLIALTAGGSMAGILGMFFALPVLVAFRTCFTTFFRCNKKC